MSQGIGFTEPQWALLTEGLRLRSYAERDSLHSLPASALLDEGTCSTLLDALGPVIGSPTRRITASLLGKRLSFLMTGACLYAMSAYDRGLALTLRNTVVEYGHREGAWVSCLPLNDLAASQPEPHQRDAWRAAVVTDLFAGLIQPLWHTLYRVTGVPRRILWENTAVRVYSLYERRLAKEQAPEVRARCEADWHWLVTEAPGEVFGLDYNPLQHFCRPPTALPGTDRCVRFRRTCCFYYQASTPVEYCSTCPLIRPKGTR